MNMLIKQTSVRFVFVYVQELFVVSHCKQFMEAFFCQTLPQVFLLTIYTISKNGNLIRFLKSLVIEIGGEVNYHCFFLFLGN